MTEIVSPARRRPPYAITLPGTPRNQEATRKLLVDALQRLEREALRTAKKAAKAAAVIAATDVATIAENKSQIKTVMLEAADLGAGTVDGARMHGHKLDVCRAFVLDRMARLLGVQATRQAISACLFGGTFELEPDIADVTPATQYGSSFSPEAALAEATRIIAEASGDELDDVDFTREPRSEREAALRKAIIARVEVGRSDKVFKGAYWVHLDLCNLADGKTPASDLREALDWWEQRAGEEGAKQKRDKRRQLLEGARADIDGDDEADYEEDEVEDEEQ